MSRTVRATSRKPRVLLLAYQCNPANPSEPRVSFDWARHLQEQVTLTVLTHERNRKAIEADGRLHCRVVYVPAEFISRPIWRLNSAVFGDTHVQQKMFIATLDYLAWASIAGRMLPPAQIRRDFDLVHRVSPKCLWWPSLGTPGEIPLVFGPVNSGMDWPPALRDEYGSAPERLTIRLRVSLMRAAIGRLSPVRRLLVANRTCLASLPASLRPFCSVLPDSAVDAENWAASAAARPRGLLRLLFVGRLIKLKGIDLLLRALADCSEVDATLQIAGEGPLRCELERQSAELGIGGRVQFLGQLDRTALRAAYQQANAFVFPSLREAGGNAVYEAMAAGLPIIAVDHGGPAELVTPSCGILIAPTSREGIVAGLAAAIRRLASEPELRKEMGRSAAAHTSAAHSWPARLQSMLAIYRSVLAAAGHEPCWG